MATIQDIRALELCIYEVVEEYLDDNDGYDHPVLHVYWDNDQMKYSAEITDGLTGGEDDGVRKSIKDQKTLCGNNRHYRQHSYAAMGIGLPLDAAGCCLFDKNIIQIWTYENLHRNLSTM